MNVRLLGLSLLVATAVQVTGCGVTGGYNMPPSAQLMHPGPGVGGPGPGVLDPDSVDLAQTAFISDGALTSAGGAMLTGGEVPCGPGQFGQEVQVLFARPEAMQISWDVSGAGTYDSMPVITPVRQNFSQGGIYRLKLTAIPGREGVELYPTIEIGPATRRTVAFLAHNAIPVQFTEEDFDQVQTGNFVTKVIYLPDPEFQELALAGVETLVSTRLDPGLDPIVEADRRGAILAVVRIGNKDMETPGSLDEGTVISEVAQAGFAMPLHAGSAGIGYAEGMPCVDGMAVGSGAGSMVGSYGPGGLPPGLTAAGLYGMPMTGTPIGLPGPPHVPLGVPAGLQKHVVRNWTRMHLPDPVSKIKINVKQRPGQSYPHPPNRAWITEDTIHPDVHYSNKHFGVPPTATHYHMGHQH